MTGTFRTSVWMSRICSAVSTGVISSDMMPVVRRAISNSSWNDGYFTNTLNMNRSCWASGSG